MESSHDPLTHAIIAGGLESTVREMTIVIVKTSRSPVLAEAYDFSNCLFDGTGQMVIQGENVPVHVGAMIEATRDVIGYFADDINPGDVLYCNDPRFLGSHLPDMVMYKPIFHGGEIVFWAANKSHMMDTGGPVAGGYNPTARDIFAEGIRISPIKLYEGGRLRYDLLDLLLSNVRIPGALRGDMSAQYSAVRTAEDRVLELIERYGVDSVQSCCKWLLDRAEGVMRSKIGEMPDGVYHGSAVLEDYGHGDGDARIEATVTIAGARLDVQLASPPQSDNYFNAYWPNTQSMVYFALLSAIDVDVPHNEGLYRPITIDFGPPGSRINAQIPAACAQATGSMAEVVWDAVADAMSKVVPDRACAGWSRPFTAIFAGIDDRTGEPWADYSLAGGMGGAGAVSGLDGWDAIGWVNAAGACHHGDVELMELKEPIRIWRHELRPDSACAGEWRGGFGAVHEVEVLGDVSLTTISDGIVYPPPGRCGAGVGKGRPANVHRKLLISHGETKGLPPQTVTHIDAGSRVVSLTSGGGGVGDAFGRDPQLVLRDVVDGLISPSVARSDYGVVVDLESMVVDQGATVHARGSIGDVQ